MTESDTSERRRIEAELERRNAFLQLLQVVSTAANGAPTSLTHALQTTVDEVCSQTGWTIGHVLLPRQDGGEGLVSGGIWHVDDLAHLDAIRHRHDGVSFAPNVGVPGRVFASGTPEHIADVRTLSADDADRVRCALIDAERMRAVAGFPIIVGDEVCAVLEFFSETPFEADRILLDVMVQVGMVLGRIVERTRYEAALRDAREVAEAASAAKSEFLSRMSHELRTPLTAVLGYAELLSLTSLPVLERGYVAAIEKGGGHLLDLINDVLDVARLDRGELRLSMEPVDVAGIIVDATGLLQPLAVSHNVALKTQFRGAERCFALSDNQALRQAMLNLIANAIKYNRQGGEVVVSVVAAPDTVQIDVADTGEGIAAADLDSIFVPFERLGAARAVEGTGLGLGISRRLVEAMGGTLQVHSELGSGTTFSVVLAATERSMGDHTATSALTSPGPTVGRGHKVLYVEDNIVNIELMQSFFTRLRPGIELVSTMLGELAVDLAREHAPDLILLDVNLPDIEGGEVIRRLNLSARTRSIPVVMVSADAIPGGIDSFLAAGAAGYITKPIQVARLLEFVDRATRGARPDDGHEIVGRLPHARKRAVTLGASPAGRA
ncbi:MAG: response regulator [Candidatus Dormibacteraeota bacterium]|uniref:histidine kinase n=1 Tax=Candidatus Amunia macphersoniae TaxID=3127014 RepID=A0A934NF81_9BACT|nr:response regulator [Candidatus Dormibacteraeota bacterium]